jgi:hypothetical protein
MRCCPSTWPEGLRKDMKNLHQGSQSAGCDLKLGPPENEQWCHPLTADCIVITCKLLLIYRRSPYSTSNP